jgi:hypothetical protein
VEILVLVKDSAAPGVQKTGDVTAIQPDGWRWGREELTDSRWRIIRTERPLLQTHVTSLLFAPRVDSFLGAEHYRAWAIALAKLPSAAKILGPRRGMIDVPATAIEDATFQRPITGKIPPRPAVTMSKIGALLALLPGTKRGEKPRLWSRRSVLRGVAVLAGIMLLARRAQAGTITKTIGSAGGRDYTTVQAFIDALPANLVTDGNSYVGD